MNKRLIVILVVIALAIVAYFLFFAGGPDCTLPEVFCIGFVTDTGGINDDSFNESQWEGIKMAADEYDAIEIQYIQSDEATQYTPNMTEFAGQGYDMVVAAGYLLTGDLAGVAVDYPDIDFVLMDDTFPNDFSVPDEEDLGHDECIPNVMGVIYKTDQAAFLAGYLAAGMTKTGKIGYFGGIPLPTVTIFGVGMQAGIEKYNEVHGTDVELIGWDSATGVSGGLFTFDFDDLTKGKEMTETLFDDGADIFIPVGGMIGAPGMDVARERGGYGIWVDKDGYFAVEGAQDVVLTSVIKLMDATMYNISTAGYKGNFVGCSEFNGDLANGGVALAPYHDVESMVPDSLQDEIEQLKSDIMSGVITDTGCISYPEWCPPGLYK